MLCGFRVTRARLAKNQVLDGRSDALVTYDNRAEVSTTVGASGIYGRRLFTDVENMSMETKMRGARVQLEGGAAQFDPFPYCIVVCRQHHGEWEDEENPEPQGESAARADEGSAEPPTRVQPVNKQGQLKQ